MKCSTSEAHWFRSPSLRLGHRLFAGLLLLLCQHAASSQGGAFSLWYGGAHLELKGIQEETEHTEFTSENFGDNWGFGYGHNLGKSVRLSFLFSMGKLVYQEDKYLVGPGVSLLVRSLEEVELSYWNIGVAAGFRVLSSARSDGQIHIGLGQRHLNRMHGMLVNQPFGAQNRIDENLGHWKPDLLLSFGLRYSYLLFDIVAPFGEVYMAPTLVNNYSDNYDPEETVNPPKVASEWGFRLGVEFRIGKRDQAPAIE